MITGYHAIRDAAQHIAGAIDRSVTALHERRIEHEPAMTDRMLGAIEESLVSYQAKGIRWSAKTLTDRGKGSQEFRHGADFMGVLNIEIPEFTVSKGFLAQAKLVRGKSMNGIKEMKKQCEKMLELSPASFVFLYGQNGVRVIPAIAIVGSSASPLKLYHHSAQRFFEDHFECFIGDREIQSATPSTLDALCERFKARSAIQINAKTEL